ncbi:hypothetical protein L195_g039652 [Trifolium pratense]|uniref:Uncharacterized protein n=1 Tax=Trifolium pratense TaxID=57577 RepID=A0A2K3LYK2_TRIPR|nr:hypothetical protein L195_g039652 [Trifolium pratense]
MIIFNLHQFIHHLDQNQTEKKKKQNKDRRFRRRRRIAGIPPQVAHTITVTGTHHRNAATSSRRIISQSDLWFGQPSFS